MLLAASDLAIGLLARNGQWPVIAELVLLLLAGAGFGAGFSPAMSRVVAQVPADSSHHASGLLASGIQLSYALGVTTLGSYYLAGQIAHAGRAFATTTIVEAGLAVAAAFLLRHLNGISAPDQANRQPRTGHNGVSSGSASRIAWARPFSRPRAPSSMAITTSARIIGRCSSTRVASGVACGETVWDRQRRRFIAGFTANWPAWECG